MPPSRLGPYVILEPIARGALWTTYRAQHQEIGRVVIVKALNPTVSVTSLFARKLVREAKILGKLRHESIVALLEFERTDESIWLALEDTRGHSLREVLRAAGGLSVEVSTAIALAVARGLGHAHRRGVVHRGLRPEHVWLSPEGRVLLNDFGAAREVSEPEEPEPLGDESAPGATDYLTPEQILGDTIGPRSDVFSLGVLTFEMIAGKRPFRSPDSKEAIRRIRSADPPPLRTGPMEVPASMERFVRRCLAKHPDDRYEDAQQAAEALEKALSELTDAPVSTLVVRALGQAKLATDIPSAKAPVRSPGAPVLGKALLQAIRPLLVVFALIVAGGAVIEIFLRREEITSAGETEPGASAGPGQLRVLARPWADVYINGERIDTTPIGRPIPLPPGQHYVTFRHPNAPDEQRSIRLSSGQSVLLDVTMRVERPAPADAGPDGRGVDNSP